MDSFHRGLLYIPARLPQAVARLELSPVPLEPEKLFHGSGEDKGIGLELEADGGRRPAAVVVSGPDRGLGRKLPEDPLDTLVFKQRQLFAGGAADLADEEEISSQRHGLVWKVNDQVIGTMPGSVEKTQGESSDLQLISIVERDRGAALGILVRGQAGSGELEGPGVPIDVVGMTMRVDNVSHLQPLEAGSLDDSIGIIRRVNQRPLTGLTVPEKIGEIAITSRSNLFKNKTHESGYFSS